MTRTGFPRPSLDRTHQPRAHTLAPVRLRHTKRINIDSDFPQVAQRLALTSSAGRSRRALTSPTTWLSTSATSHTESSDRGRLSDSLKNSTSPSVDGTRKASGSSST